MSRPVAGLACRIRIPVRQYQAVAVLVAGKNHVIRLLHRDAALSIDVEEFENFHTAEEYRDRLASFLDLPPMLMAGAPAAEAEPAGSAPIFARRDRSARTRRPRFLKRRRVGADIAIRPVVGREIIARN